ncbi:MAG: spsL [Candidatus Saganbacteria bacterium]|uniref:SpsL n=1 Tax=Candidatus Saganbacteria bacterium TaxID=2575572 RepID=A0A833L2K4_UNCSA|nr:MAG: spsL [Candidatus Saganbacteria bacterium]
MVEFAKIEGVQKIALKRNSDDRGYVTELMRSDDKFFNKFGQVYIATCYKGVVKAWHLHEIQTDYFYVPFGTTKIGLYDDRPNSKTKGKYQVEILGEKGEDALLIIPPFVWHGQMAISAFSGVINIPTELYNKAKPDEFRKSVDEFEDIWTVKSR